MKIVSLWVSCISLFALSGIALGEESSNEKTKTQPSVATRIDNEMDKHESSIRALDREFADRFAELKADYMKQRQVLRDRVTKKLSAEQDRLTKDGELDLAIQIRQTADELSAKEIALPKLDRQTGPDGKMVIEKNPLLGTWRWNNGVDIKNLPGGKTSGRGTWRLLDRERQLYMFDWPKIPPDRVRLSPNGRVLEGTKATDATFRVWAVRVD